MKIIKRQRLQVPVPTDGDKIETQTFAFENLKVLSKNIKDKI